MYVQTYIKYMYVHVAVTVSNWYSIFKTNNLLLIPTCTGYAVLLSRTKVCCTPDSDTRSWADVGKLIHYVNATQYMLCLPY